MKFKHYIGFSLAMAGLLAFGAGCSSSSAPTNDALTLPSNNQGQPVAQAGYTATQVATHKTTADCWFIINNKVYNVTSYLPNHPGGDISSYCGTDATSVFEAKPTDGAPHSNRAQQALAQLLVGDLTK